MKVVVDLNDFRFKLFQGGWNGDTYKSFLEFILKSSMKFGNVGVNSASLSVVMKFSYEKSSFVRGTKVRFELCLEGHKVIK